MEKLRRKIQHMKKILDLLSAEVAKAFAAAGYDEKYARVSISNRPDLCEY